MKHLEENVREKLHNIGFGDDFLDMTLKVQITKAKMGKLDFLKIKKELCFKRHYPQSKKVTLGMGEIICKS